MEFKSGKHFGVSKRQIFYYLVMAYIKILLVILLRQLCDGILVDKLAFGTFMLGITEITSR